MMESKINILKVVLMDHKPSIVCSEVTHMRLDKGMGLDKGAEERGSPSV